MMNKSLLIPAHGNPIALKRTIDSFKEVCVEIVIGDLFIAPEHRELVKTYASEYNIKFVRFQFNDLFKHGFSYVLNKLADHATNNIVLYMNVGEVIDGKMADKKLPENYNAFCFDHATDPHRWFRMYDKTKLHFSGGIHEELRAKSIGVETKYCPTPLFRMADTEKDNDNSFVAKIMDSVKEAVYFRQYLNLVEKPELQGGTNPGWVKYAQDSYQHIKDRLEAKGNMLKAFETDNYLLLMDHIKHSMEFHTERMESSKLISFQSDGGRVGITREDLESAKKRLGDALNSGISEDSVSVPWLHLLKNNYTVIIPHFRVGQATAYAVSQLLKFKGNRTLNIIVVDNSNFEGLEYLEPFKDQIKIITYPPDRLQSHGVAIDYILQGGHVTTDYFIMCESDSFPTSEKFFDYIDEKVEQGYDAIGSILHLSGGRYLHPAGCAYKTSCWHEAMEYAKTIDYSYFPNMGRKNDFDCHVMIRNDILNLVLDNPPHWGIEYSQNYIGKSREEILKMRDGYKPICGVFHNGMGNSNESYYTYGQRDLDTYFPDVVIEPEKRVVHRLGAEPGQWFSWWMLENRKKICNVTTGVKWLPNRVNQQQECTVTNHDYVHLWGVSAYSGCNVEELQDIVQFKEKQITDLYNSLPENQKI